MKIVTSLSFNGQCREAFEFYAKVLGGKITAAFPFGDGPPGAHMDASKKDWLMHCWLDVGDQSIMGADMPSAMYEAPHGFSLSLQISTVAEAERVFAGLAEGGTVKMPLEKTFWAERFGSIVDRFGIPWQVNCEGAAAHA